MRPWVDRVTFPLNCISVSGGHRLKLVHRASTFALLMLDVSFPGS
jgi:hypothetical protein